MVVFYGSQTGTAEGFAGRLAKDARSFGLPSMVYDPEDCMDWVSCDCGFILKWVVYLLLCLLSMPLIL